MANTIQLAHSSTADEAPSSTLAAGEVAINSSDRKIWVGDGSANQVIFQHADYLTAAYDTTTNVGADYTASSGSWTFNTTTTEWDTSYTICAGNAYTSTSGLGTTNTSHITYAVPSGMKSAYVAHLLWSNCGYFDVVGIEAGGTGEVFIQRIHSYQNIQNTDEGVSHDGVSVFKCSGMDRFDSIKFYGRKGRVHLMGIGWTKEDDKDTHPGALNLIHHDNVVGTSPWLSTGGGTLTDALEIRGGLTVSNSADTLDVLVAPPDGDVYMPGRLAIGGTTHVAG